MKNFISFLAALTLCLGALSAESETLTVGSIHGQPGETVFLPISVDVPENIAGAAFTITYNSNYFTLIDIQSAFFDTFANQWLSLEPAPDPMPPSSVTVNGIEYNRPLVFNNVENATMIAAARVKTGSSEKTLFTLQFVVSTDIPSGIYPVSISATSIANIAAGYVAEGETIPILVGAIEGESDPFPVIPTGLVNGTITINTTIPDSDDDGLPDSWEIEHFGGTDIADNISDYDNDGYTDLQEYLNGIALETDMTGAVYDPKVANASGGTGYVLNGQCGTANGSSFITTPTLNLCSSGTTSFVSGTGPWTWICEGSDGGTDASCSANVTTWSVTSSAGDNGSINPVGVQTVKHESSISFDVTPGANFIPVIVGTCGGSMNGSLYTTDPITSDCTVEVTFTAAAVSGVCGLADGAIYDNIPPVSDLCSEGEAIGLSGNGPWSWMCEGINGGSNADCSTDIEPANPINNSAFWNLMLPAIIGGKHRAQ